MPMNKASIAMQRPMPKIAVAVLLGSISLAFLPQQDNSGPRPPGRANTNALIRAGHDVDGVSASLPTFEIQTGRVDRSIYIPEAPLEPQLGALRKLSDGGNRYATCILAFALDFCARGPDRMIVSDSLSKDPSAMNEEDIERIAENLEFQKRYVTTCAELDTNSFVDMDQRLFMSAAMGSPRSMARFALLPERPDSNGTDPNSQFALNHRNNAESMLNKAAEAGDPDAIRGIQDAYSLGYITSAMEPLEVTKDPAKSLAALSVLSQQYSQEDQQSVRAAIRNELAQMDAGQKSRFLDFSERYKTSATKHATRLQYGDHVVDDFPEYACDSVDP
jgi:hypothetical protein